MTFEQTDIAAILVSAGIEHEVADALSLDFTGAFPSAEVFATTLAQAAYNHRAVNLVAFKVASRATMLWAAVEADLHPRNEPVERLRDYLFHLSRT